MNPPNVSPSDPPPAGDAGPGPNPLLHVHAPGEKQLPLASPPFWTLQGEGHLRGKQMVFLRLAGCSVGCAGCDTDYSRKINADPPAAAAWCDALMPAALRDRWVWVTGGEPTDHDLLPLLRELKDRRMLVALATSGHRRVPPQWERRIDWLSVSPHDPAKWEQTHGSEVKIVPGLNGYGLDDFYAAHPDDRTDFCERYVQPLSVNGVEQPESLAECKAWLALHPNWSLSRQDHHHWGVA